MATPGPADNRPESLSAPGRAPAAVAWFRARLHGRVQGVGFRMWTVDTAESLGVNGWVRNCSDGDVEVEAEGPRGILERFASRLEEGPTLARIQDFHIEWGERAPRHIRFAVTY